MSLADLKASMGGSLAKLKDATAKKEKEADNRFWSPTFDREAGNSNAIIRFLPAPQGEEFPFVKVYSHAFQGGTGKWYIENSRSTLNERDAVSNLNYRLWNSGVESDKIAGRPLKRKVNYYANVLVINDQMKPENNGKVFLFKYGSQIAGIVEDAMFPKTTNTNDEFSDDNPKIVEAINPFDPWGGSNFVIRMNSKEMPDTRTGKTIIVPTYDKSSFKTPSAMAETDDEIEAIWSKAHSLAAFVAEDQFKSNEALAKRLYEVLGDTIGSGIKVVEGFSRPTEIAAVQQAPEQFDDVPPFAKAETKSTQAPAASKAKSEPVKSGSSEEDLDFLKNLLNSDD